MNILEVIKNEPYKIGHLVGFDLLTPMHNEWIKSFMFGTEDKTLLVHRGSYKTVSVSIAIALLMIIKPDKSIMFMRKTDDDIAEIVKRIGSILQTDIFKAIVFQLYGMDLKLKTFTQSIIDTNLNISNKGTPQLLGKGINGSITGKHYDLIFTDDIVNVDDRLYTAKREFTKIVYQELQNVRNRGGRIINTATKWHKEDAISIMPNQTILTCYDTGLMTKEQIQQIRASMTPSLFAANYELKCIADENALFTNPEFTDDIASIYDGLCHVDAAYGGEDYTAFTIMKKTNEGIVAFGKLYHKHVNDCIPDMLALAQEYRAGTWLCERNADKGYLADKLSEFGIPTYSYPESMNKYIKISTHLYRIWKQIKWLDTTDNEYLNQILDYTEQAEHEDAPDSAASLSRHLVGNEISAIKGLRL